MKIPSSPGAEDKSEIKSEIQIIKSLLLNRNQFPALPVVTPVGLPSWQLATKSVRLDFIIRIEGKQYKVGTFLNRVKKKMKQITSRASQTS